MYGYIYKTTNLVNGKIYIGQHKGKFDKNYLGSGTKLKLALKKYGKKNFSVEVLCLCETFEGTNEAEIQYISEYKSIDRNIGYNITEGGEGSKGCYVGIPRTKETKIKISKSQSGCNNPMYGIPAPNRKPIRCIETGEIFPSALSTGIRHSKTVANGKRKTAGGYTWEWAKD